MVHSQLRRAAFVLIALFSLGLSVSDTLAQTYYRNVLFEEFTGTWCGYCPRGAWYCDSLSAHMPDNAVIISWHNRTTDPMNYSPEGEATMAAFFQPPGYPNILVDRWASGNVGFWEDDPTLYEQYIQADAQTPPLINLEIKNITYQPTSKTVNFDLVISPSNGAHTIPTEDTTEYRYLVVLTQDSLVYSQTNYNLKGLPNPIPKFVHDNAAVQTDGKALGNKFDMQSQSASPSYPITIHRSVKFGGKLLNIMKANKIRIKAAVLTYSKGTIAYNYIHNAAQSNYVSTYPAPKPGVMTITSPKAGDIVEAGSNTPIVFTATPEVTALKNFQYSLNNGTTWANIGAISSDVTTYNGWIVGDSSSTQALVRVTDGNSVTASSGMFTIHLAPGFTGLTNNKFLNNKVNANTVTKFSWTVKGSLSGPNKWIQMSTDNKATWNDVVSITSDVTFADWTTPDQDIPVAYFKITDKYGAEFVMVDPVAIQKPKGTFANLQLNGVVSGKIGADVQTSFTWTYSGTVGNTKHIEWSNDNKATWASLVQIDGDVTSANWKTASGYHPAAFFRIWSAGDQSDAFETTIPIQVGEQSSVKNLGGAPTAFNMSTNYPNPFASVTTINFDVPERAFVTLTVRNELGQEVARLANETMDAGKYSAAFDAKNFSNGLYTYTLESGSTKLVGKMSVVK